jgi:HEAT repeat protein
MRRLIRHDNASKMLDLSSARFVALGIAASMLLAAPAVAQVNPYRVQQRYNEARKGKSIEDWTKRLNDPDPAKRLEAVKSLGESGQPDAIEYLIQATGDPDEAVKIKAIDYLGKLRATDATQVLVQKLFMRDVAPPLKQRILVALGRMGDAKAAQPISEFIKQSNDPAVAGTAIFALGEIGDASVVPNLQDLQRTATDPNMARLAGEAVAKINLRLSPASVAVTVPALEEDRPRPRGK